jgi:hypothetical protein
MVQGERFDHNQAVSRAIEDGVDAQTFFDTAIYTAYLVWCNFDRANKNPPAAQSPFSKLQPLYNLVKIIRNHPEFQIRRDGLIRKLNKALQEIQICQGQQTFTETELEDLAKLKQLSLPGDSLATIVEEPRGGQHHDDSEDAYTRYGSSVISLKPRAVSMTLRQLVAE